CLGTGPRAYDAAAQHLAVDVLGRGLDFGVSALLGLGQDAGLDQLAVLGQGAGKSGGIVGLHRVRDLLADGVQFCLPVVVVHQGHDKAPFYHKSPTGGQAFSTSFSNSCRIQGCFSGPAGGVSGTAGFASRCRMIPSRTLCCAPSPVLRPVTAVAMPMSSICWGLYQALLSIRFLASSWLMPLTSTSACIPCWYRLSLASASARRSSA